MAASRGTIANFLPVRAVRFKLRQPPGEYGEGDKFLGVAVPHLRRLARTQRDSTLAEIRSRSAEYVVGAHLASSHIALLCRLARSRSVWERRIARLSTRHWIRQGNFEPALEIAEMLLGDDHDLIHKAADDAALRDREVFRRRSGGGISP